MSAKKKAVAQGVGAQRNGHPNCKNNARCFSHIASYEAMPIYVAIYADRQFVGLRSFENRAAAREAMRANGGLI